MYTEVAWFIGRGCQFEGAIEQIVSSIGISPVYLAFMANTKGEIYGMGILREVSIKKVLNPD